VKFANESVAQSGRRVDFMHIPTLDTVDESYYAPLKDLKVGDTNVYLGSIHGMSDLNRFRKRIELAHKFVPRFGLAAPCGFGRHQPNEVPGLLKDHRKAVEILHEVVKQ
jgi:hypothetical protein